MNLIIFCIYFKHIARYNSDPSPNEVRGWTPNVNTERISRTSSTSSLPKNVAHPSSPPPHPPFVIDKSISQDTMDTNMYVSIIH